MLLLGGQVFNSDGRALTGDPAAPSGSDPETLVRLHRAKRYRSAFAPPLLDESMARETGLAFHQAGICLAEYGYWENLLDTDPDVRKRNRRAMQQALQLADEAGVVCCLNILGSYCRGHGTSRHDARNFSKDAFAEAVDIARWLIDTVKPKRTRFAYELFPFGVIDSPEACERLVRAVDRKEFAVHLDLVNMVNSPRTYWRTAELLDETLKFVGEHIISVHVKDIRMHEPAISVLLSEVPCGQGVVDFPRLFRSLNSLNRSLPVLMEHLNSEIAYDASAAYLREQASMAGIVL